MRILAVTPQIPWPTDTGGKIRTYQLLSALAATHEVTLVSFDGLPHTVAGPLEHSLAAVHRVYRSTGPFTRAVALTRGLRGPAPFTIEQYRSAEMREVLQRVAGEVHPELVYLDSLHTAQYRNAVRLVPAVLDEHNVESMVWERLAQHERSRPRRWLLGQQAALLRGYEADRCRGMDRVLSCSAEDRRALLELAGAPWAAEPERVWVVPNGTDTSAFDGDIDPAPLGGRPLVFVGSMDWAPNADAVRWYADEILPRVRARVPDAHFYAVGRNPDRGLRALNGRPGLSVLGGVPDVRPYLLAAELAPVPLRSGGGTRLKILEAQAAGRAVVSTTVGAEGLDLVNGKEILLADGAEHFAAKLIALLEDPERRAAIAAAGTDAVRQRYDWRSIGAVLARRVVGLAVANAR